MKNKTVNIYTEWKPLIDGLSNEEAGKLLKDILAYQNGEEVENSNPVWLFIKAKIDEYNENGKVISQARSNAGKIGMAKRWGITNDNKNNKCYQMITNDNKNNNKIKENKIKKNKNINNKIINNKNINNNLQEYGELKNVLLTEEDYNRLKNENPFFLDAIEKLDSWLDTKNGEKNKGRNHRAYFKSNSWVWENLKPKPTQTVWEKNMEIIKQMKEKGEV